MPLVLRLRLSLLMFLQLFVWGAWFVTLGTYLFEVGFDGVQIGQAYSTTAWAALLAPLFVGMVADRFFAAEKLMGVLHLGGAGLVYWASSLTEPQAFFWVLLLYTLSYMPTVALANAVAFGQMEDPGAQFPGVRVWGTIGWIAVGWIVGLMGVEATALPLRLAAVAAVVTGLYCFTLPHTPPRAAGKRAGWAQVLGLDAFGLLRDRSFAVFALCALLVSVPLSFYYNFANAFLNQGGMENAAGKMTFGQMSEIVFMVLMPFFFRRLGVKWMLLAGMLAWVLRYALFAWGDTGPLVWMLYGGILLHGVCYDFFFVTGQIYVDRHAPAEMRASAQGLVALLTLGAGMLVGAWVSGWIVELYALAGGGHDWSAIWWVPAGMALAVAGLFAALFRENKDGVAAAA